MCSAAETQKKCAFRQAEIVTAKRNALSTVTPSHTQRSCHIIRRKAIALIASRSKIKL